MQKSCKESISLYIHWPFCISKCPYCDFNSHVNRDIDITQFIRCYLLELFYFRDFLQDKQITSIYFGGGTPSLAPPAFFLEILETIGTISACDSTIEITMEANPSSSEYQKFLDFRNAGINRVSLGVQSFEVEALKFLGRAHSAQEAKDAIIMAKEIFPRYSFDLIYALPNQSLEAWLTQLNEAKPLIGDHISLYQLTIEKGTPFYMDYKRHKFIMPDDEMAITLYQETEKFLQKLGIYRYEVSNYAKKGAESKHNLNYWLAGNYLGIGPGAHSRLSDNNRKKAIVMEHNPKTWMQKVQQNGAGIQTMQDINPIQQYEEMIMMGLRTTTGVPLGSFYNPAIIHQLQKDGLIVMQAGNVVVRDIMLLNYIISQILLH